MEDVDLFNSCCHYHRRILCGNQLHPEGGAVIIVLAASLFPNRVFNTSRDGFSVLDTGEFPYLARTYRSIKFLYRYYNFQ